VTNIELLDRYIRESGLKRKKIAECLGITLNGLKKKTTGQHEFKASEIQVLCVLLGINTSDEKERIFFARNGE